MEMTITISLSPEATQLLTDIVNLLKPAQPAQTAQTAQPTPAQKHYTPFTEPDLVVASEAAKAEADQQDINISTIRALVKDKADAGLKAEIKELLTQHGAANVSQLKPSAYSRFYADLQNL